MSLSIVEYHSLQEKQRCGYCKGSNTSFSYGMTAHSLTVQDYQNLIDRGWRRSGSYCYKPMMDRTCCPHYTIKCKVLDFKISKSQKKNLKRMIKFIKGELSRDEDAETNSGNHDDFDRGFEITNYAKCVDMAKKNAAEMHVTSMSPELSKRLHSDGDKHDSNSSKQGTNISPNFANKSIERPGATRSLNLDPNKTPPKKAKLLRLQRKQNKLLAQGKSQEEVDALMKKGKQQTNTKTLEEYFDEIQKSSDTFEMRLVRVSPMSEAYAKHDKESFEVFKKYQISIHGDKPHKVTEQRYKNFLVNSPFAMRLVRVTSDEFFNTLNESASVFKKYQMAIHNDLPMECDKESFIEFLVKSPLQESVPSNGPPQGYGSFHEQYWLNGTLIAVVVLDILPSCISSVYFFYDPAYSHLSLGTFSSLREVYLTKQLNKTSSMLKYYYMGFYIHTCPKMRYKARMQPSELLCPETYAWCSIEKCLSKLDKEKNSRLNEDLDAIDECARVDIDQVLILYRRKATHYEFFKRHFPKRDDEEEIKEYAFLVGNKCAGKMLLYRN